MRVDPQMLINARRCDLQSKRTRFVCAALQGGMSWEDATEIGNKAVPQAEFDFLDGLSERTAKDMKYTFLIVGMVALAFVAVIVGVSI